MTTLLIDGDPIAYAKSCANENTIDWGDGEPTVSFDVNAAITEMDAEIERIKRDVGVKKVIVAISCSSAQGWRRQVLPTYKHKRAGVIPPGPLTACKAHLADKWKAYLRPTLEADDVLGILATHPTLVPGDKIVVSIDKDLLQVPGRVYNPRRETMEHVSVEQADYRHMMQTLTGDTVDGYTGLPGCGPKGAAKMLAAYGVQWSTVVTAYEAKGLTEEDALVQARVARICRASDYDFKLKKVKLWQPSHTATS